MYCTDYGFHQEYIALLHCASLTIALVFLKVLSNKIKSLPLYVCYSIVTSFSSYSSLARGGNSTPSCFEPSSTMGVP